MVLLAVLSGVGCLAYPYALPPAVLARRVSHHETLRAAALAWRQQFAVDPAAAKGMQVWHRASFDESCCLPTMASATDPGDYLLVQPVTAAAEAGVPNADRVIDEPATRWEMELKGLAPQLQTATLGEELLTRGSVVVELVPEQPGPTLHVASARSTEDGKASMEGVSLVPFLGCLPILDSPLAESVLSSPEGQANPAGRYWLARGANEAAMILAPTCSPAGGKPLEMRTLPLPGNAYVLLTERGSTERSSFLLTFPTEGASHPPQLLRPNPLDPTQIELIGVISESGIPKSGAAGATVPVEQLFDAFQSLPSPTTDLSRAVVRRLDRDVLSYLVPDGKSWTWAGCPNPAEDNYLIVKGNCAAFDRGQYVSIPKEQQSRLERLESEEESRPGAFTASLGPAVDGHPLRSREVFYVDSWTTQEDKACNFRATPSPCVGALPPTR
jgi:hypothetical protein